MFAQNIVVIPLMFFGAVVCYQNKYCQYECNYGTQTFSHTVCDRQQLKCGPDPQSCGPEFKVLKLTDPHRQYIVDLHNYFRNRVALGEETRGGQPPASNMRIMRYNKELEYVAQCWANACKANPLRHDHCRRTGNFEYVGQNLGHSNNSIAVMDIYEQIKALTTLWYEEVVDFQSDWVKYTKDRGPRYKVGHYTQLIWADSTDIGCALAYYTTLNGQEKWHQIIYVCNYGPGGNYLGLPVYIVGDPATKCPEGYKPNYQYKGLCGNSERVLKSFENNNN